jgi:cytochrome c peroxidase
VAHAGSHEITIISLPALIDSALAYAGKAVFLGYKLDVLPDIRKSCATSAVGPRSLAIIGDSVYTIGYFNGAPIIEQIPIALGTDTARLSFSIGETVKMSAQRQGEATFYDARIAYQKWRSCHTCHAFAGSDGYTWILNSGATGSPKNTKSLTNSWWTPPLKWEGRRADGHTAVTYSVMMELFSNATDSIAFPLDTFLMNLKPLPSPYLQKGVLSESAKRGKALFYSEKGGCTVCHIPPLFCNNKLYDAVVQDPFSSSAINTPSLIECWKSGPYGHLGSYKEIREIITIATHNKLQTSIGNGETTLQDIEDLVEFVLSL